LERNQLSQLVLDGWEYFADVESADELKVVIKTLVKSGSLPGIERFDIGDVWRCVQERQEGKGDDSFVTEGDLKIPEWEVLTAPTPPTDWPQFMSRPEPPPAAYTGRIAGVLLLERLREVNALIGYTRVEAPEETTDPDERPRWRRCRVHVPIGFPLAKCMVRESSFDSTRKPFEAGKIFLRSSVAAKDWKRDTEGGETLVDRTPKRATPVSATP
jgi:hypothetical protein